MTRSLGRTELPRVPESAAEARHWLAKLLGGDHPAFDDIELMTSELVTNSIKHTDSTTVSVAVTLVGEHRIHVAVTDDGHPVNRPYLTDLAPDSAEYGRGLHLVSLLATYFGVTDDSAGRVVWFEVTF